MHLRPVMKGDKGDTNLTGLPFSWARRKLPSELLCAESCFFSVTPALGQLKQHWNLQSEAPSHRSLATRACKGGGPLSPCHQTECKVGSPASCLTSHTQKRDRSNLKCVTVSMPRLGGTALRGGHGAREAREMICCLPGSGPCCAPGLIYNPNIAGAAKFPLKVMCRSVRPVSQVSTCRVGVRMSSQPSSGATAAPGGPGKPSNLTPAPLASMAARPLWNPAPRPPATLPPPPLAPRADSFAGSALICVSFGFVCRNCRLLLLRRPARPWLPRGQLLAGGILQASPRLQPGLRLCSAGPWSPRLPLQSGCAASICSGKSPHGQPGPAWEAKAQASRNAGAGVQAPLLAAPVQGGLWTRFFVSSGRYQRPV